MLPNCARLIAWSCLGSSGEFDQRPQVRWLASGINAPEGSCDAEEFCCNEFAAALLMPDRWFWEDVCLGYTDQELSAMYDLSVSAVRVRRAEMINVHR